MKNSPTEVKKKETEERKRQEELEKQKRNETYQLLGGSQNDSDADDDSSLDGNIQQLENYSYFDGDKILESLKLAPKDRKNGEAIYRQQKMNVTDISCGYDRMNGQRLGQIKQPSRLAEISSASPFFSLTRKLLMQDADARNATENTGAGILIIPGASIQLHLPSIFVIM